MLTACWETGERPNTQRFNRKTHTNNNNNKKKKKGQQIFGFFEVVGFIGKYVGYFGVKKKKGGNNFPTNFLLAPWRFIEFLSIEQNKNTPRFLGPSIASDATSFSFLSGKFRSPPFDCSFCCVDFETRSSFGCVVGGGGVSPTCKKRRRRVKAGRSLLPPPPAIRHATNRLERSTYLRDFSRPRPFGLVWNNNNKKKNKTDEILSSFILPFFVVRCWNFLGFFFCPGLSRERRWKSKVGERIKNAGWRDWPPNVLME